METFFLFQDYSSFLPVLENFLGVFTKVYKIYGMIPLSRITVIIQMQKVAFLSS